METTFAFDYTQRHAEELGISDSIKSLYDQAKASVGVSIGQVEEIAARSTMVLLTCAVAGIDVEKNASDAKFVRRHTSYKIKKHVINRVTASCCLNGPAFQIPLPLASETLLTLIEDDEPQWEQFLMAVTGNFGINKKTGDHVLEIIEEAEAEEVVVIPQDTIDFQTNNFEAWEHIGEADYCYGYPIWAGQTDVGTEGQWIVRVRTFEGTLEDYTNVNVEDYDLFIEEKFVQTLKRWVEDIETPGPIRSKLVTFVTNEGEVWDAYDTRFVKILPEEVCEMFEKEDEIREGDGFNLGDVHFLQESLKSYNLTIRYWGGFAKIPKRSDPLSHGRLGWSIVSKKGYVDLLGHREWTYEYENCREVVPHVGVNYTSNIPEPDNYLDLITWKMKVKTILTQANKVRLPLEKIQSWCKNVGRLPNAIVEPFMATLSAKNNGGSVTPWKAAWTLVAQQRGLNPADREKVAMTAGDFIMLGPLVGKKAFFMDGVMLGI